MDSNKQRGYQKILRGKRNTIVKQICIMNIQKMIQKMREYHIDTYHKFTEFTPTMSMRSGPNSHPLLLLVG